MRQNDDSKRIIRQWDREIEDETRRSLSKRDSGPWRIVVWVALWSVWLVGLVILITWLRKLHW